MKLYLLKYDNGNTLHNLNFKMNWPQSAKLRGGVVKGVYPRGDMGGGRAIFCFMCVNLLGGAMRWANEFKNIS